MEQSNVLVAPVHSHSSRQMKPSETALADTETESEFEFAYRTEHPEPAKARLPEFYKGQWWADAARNVSADDIVEWEITFAMVSALVFTVCCTVICK